MSLGLLTCIRAIAAAAKVAIPRRRPPGAILSPVRPRSLAGALNAEAEGRRRGRGTGWGHPHRTDWRGGGVDFWNEPPGQPYITAGEGRTAEQGTRAAHEFAMARHLIHAG